MPHANLLAFLASACEFAPQEGAREAEVEKVLDTFMLMYVLAINHTRATASAMPKLWERSKKYPHWSATQSWARDIRREVVGSVGESRTAYSTTVQVAERGTRVRPDPLGTRQTEHDSAESPHTHASCAHNIVTKSRRESAMGACAADDLYDRGSKC